MARLSSLTFHRWSPARSSSACSTLTRTHPRRGGTLDPVRATNGASFSVSHFVTYACVSDIHKPYRASPRGLGLFRPLQRLRHRGAAKDEAVSDAQLVA